MQIAQIPTQIPAKLKLVFAEVGPGPTLELGPFRQVTIDGEALRAERNGPMLAEHKATSWVVRDKSFFRVDCAWPVRLHFENADGETSAVSAPFMHFSCADGIAYGDGEIVGNIDLETKLWYSHRDGRYWRELVVTSAAAPAS